MSPATITLLFLLFAIVMFVWEKIPLGVTSMIICVGLVVTGVSRLENSICRVYRQQCHFVRGNVYCRGSIV